MKHLALLLALLPGVMIADYTEACTYVVDPYGTGDFPTIQAAIDAAADGDVICLTNGHSSGKATEISPIVARQSLCGQRVEAPKPVSSTVPLATLITTEALSLNETRETCQYLRALR